VKKPVLVGVVIVAVILGVLVYSSMNLAKYRVEVCMEFHGQAACKTAAGASKEFAQRTATTNACAALGASGVTDSIACENTAPAKVTWK
jgi:hypothetical protein